MRRIGWTLRLRTMGMRAVGMVAVESWRMERDRSWEVRRAMRCIHFEANLRMTRDAKIQQDGVVDVR
jgi:hypothetical protein